MPTTIGFGKLERTLLSADRLPHSVQIARILFKQQIRSRAPGLTRFKNAQNVLPAAAKGQLYYEFPVGWATAPTPEFPTPAGSHRLVALVDARDNVLKMYYTRSHYAAQEWWELQYP